MCQSAKNSRRSTGGFAKFIGGFEHVCLVYNPEQIRQHIPEGIMHEFPLVQHYIEQGIERGARKTTIDSILTLLGTRFQPDAVHI